MRLIPAACRFRASSSAAPTWTTTKSPPPAATLSKVSYATSLMRQGVLISTTEHLLSALIGLGVDNIIVEIDNLEVPILDGSAQPYVEAILASGLKGQRRKREYIKILKPVEVHENSGAGSKFIGVYPGEGYSIHYSIDFPSPIGRDTFIGDLEAGDYANLIAPARTFGFREDEAMLRDMGLIRACQRSMRDHHRRRTNSKRRTPLHRRVRPSQGSRSHRRSSPRRSPHLGTRRSRARRPRHAHRPGAAPATGSFRVGSRPPLRRRRVHLASC